MPHALNPRYTFPTFIVGRSNESAYTAASAAAVSPGRLHNPVLVSGATGLGKTHLAHAVAAEATMRGDRRAILVTADEFLALIADATRTGTTSDVIAQLTSAELLIVDDVHVLDKHAAAQEALAALATRAVTQGVQLLLTSDSASGADALATRLVRKFRSAHVASLGTPDWSHRVAILHAKARERRVDLPPSVAHHLATQPGHSVREMEGNLTRLLAIAQLGKEPLSLGLARRAFPTRQREGSEMLGAQDVQEAVAAEWGISLDALIGPGRSRSLSEPRRIGMLLCREVLGLSLREIGSAFGDRDVSTVTSALSHAREAMVREPATAERVARLRELLPVPGAAPITESSPR